MQNQWNTCFPRSPKPLPPSSLSYLRRIIPPLLFFFLNIQVQNGGVQTLIALAFAMLMRVNKYVRAFPDGYIIRIIC